jgi:hypothetical protein
MQRNEQYQIVLNAKDLQIEEVNGEIILTLKSHLYKQLDSRARNTKNKNCANLTVLHPELFDALQEKY